VTLTVIAAALTGARAPEPPSPGGDPGPSPTLGQKPPLIDDRTVVLFEGKSWDRWRTREGAASPWTVQDDGSVLAGGGDAITADTFGDFQLHLEFLCPDMGDKTGQARANSGVYLHGRYEVQVLDTFGIDPHGSGCAAIYSIAPPEVNACRPPGEWQTYDIVFRAPRFGEDGAVTSAAVITVVQNGVVVHNNRVLPHSTPGGVAADVVARGPVLLQDHGDPVRYRNVWIRRLSDPVAP